MAKGGMLLQQANRKKLVECTECGCVADTHNVDGTGKKNMRSWVDRTSGLCNVCDKK